MKGKTHIVLICAHFHPLQHIAAQRMNAFVRYLNKEKYNITVLSSTNCASEGASTFEGAEVYYLPGNRILKLRKQTQGMPRWKHHLFSLNNKCIRLFSKSDLPGWQHQLNKKMEELHQIKPIDVVLSSFFPLDAHIAGLEFKKKHPEICWIADMRDEMSQNKLLSAKEQSFFARMEKEIGHYVDVITSVSKPILDGFKIQMPREEIVFLEVRNGFDHEVAPKVSFNETFTFTYAGTFYGKRKPDTFFNALVHLKEENRLPENWLIRFIGTPENFSIPSALKSNVVFLSTLPNEEVITYLQNSDCNLLIHPPTEAKGIFTGKLFDYLSVEKPVLALVDTSDVAAELINECKAGISVDFYDIPEISKAIRSMIDRWSVQEVFPYDSEKILTLHRRYQVEKLEFVLQEMIQGRGEK